VRIGNNLVKYWGILPQGNITWSNQDCGLVFQHGTTYCIHKSGKEETCNVVYITLITNGSHIKPQGQLVY